VHHAPSKLEEEEVAAVAAAEALVGGIGLVVNSRVGTPNYVDSASGFVDGGVGIFILNLEDIGAAVPPLPPSTQQSTEGYSWQVPHRQLLFPPEATFQQELPAAPPAATQAVQRPVVLPVLAKQQPTQQQLVHPQVQVMQ
jgi:hypothetical protein